MTPELRDRIEQIRHGNVPEGYKRTRSGIVPLEWNEVCLGDIYTERKEPGNENLPMLMVSIHSGVSDGEVDEADLPKKVKRIEDKSQYRRAAKGDLVFNMMRAWQGAIGTVRTEGMVSPAYIVAEPNDMVDPLFMDYYMKTKRMVQTIHRQSYGVTDFRLRLYWDSFAPIQCVLPSVEEQKKIAEILTAQDKVIELKEKRLAEKRKQKQYLMQQLLNAEKVQGAEWIKKKLCDLCSMICDGDWIESKDQSHSGIRLIQTGNIGVGRFNNRNSKARYIDQNTFDKFGCTEVYSGDVLVSRLPDPIGRACIIPNFGERAITAVDCTILRFTNSEDAQYFVQYASSINYFREVGVLAGGSTRSRISRKELENLLIPMPENDLKKRYILEICDAADKEIDLLCCGIELEKQKKKALMQLLLTGIVRV